MKIFLIVMEYLIPILLILSGNWWLKMSKRNINPYSGIRTIKSIKNQENWKKIHILASKISIIYGLVLFGIVTLARFINLVPIEIEAIIVVFIEIVALIVFVIHLNRSVD